MSVFFVGVVWQWEVRMQYAIKIQKNQHYFLTNLVFGVIFEITKVSIGVVYAIRSHQASINATDQVARWKKV
jgi:hypothetical protein